MLLEWKWPVCPAQLIPWPLVTTTIVLNITLQYSVLSTTRDKMPPRLRNSWRHATNFNPLALKLEYSDRVDPSEYHDCFAFTPYKAWHQELWCWLCRINRLFSSMEKNNFKCFFNVCRGMIEVQLCSYGSSKLFSSHKAWIFCQTNDVPISLIFPDYTWLHL